MKTHYNDLKHLVDVINRNDFLTYTIKVTKRNGHYAIDAYENKDVAKMRCTFIDGMTAKECYNYLLGIRHSIFYMKPF